MSDGAYFRLPTWRERVARLLGYRFHLGGEPDGTDPLNGWMKTEVRLNFSFGDRLRLLATGRLRVHVVQYMDVQPSVIMNRIDWQIGAPLEGGVK